MAKIVALHPNIATVGDDALQFMDNWKSDMVPNSKVVIVYSDSTGAYNTYAVNCSMTEAIGYSALATEMLLDQVRPK